MSLTARIRWKRWVILVVWMLTFSPGFGAGAATTQRLSDAPDTPQACSEGVQSTGALYQICLPDPSSWNGELVVYAHGYISPTEPLAIPDEAGKVAGIVNGMGYAFATSSYSTNGLAVVQGLADLVDLVDIFTAQQGEPARVYIIGFSEGGLITTLAVEDHPEVFDGGLAMCGPIGDFRDQIDYFGDFRVVFDYYFPGLMPPTPIDIPAWLLDEWEGHFSTAIEPALRAPENEGSLLELLAVTGAAYDTDDPDTRVATVEQVLWYNVFATGDGIDKLGGQPFDNTLRVYSGGEDDAQLNQEVARFAADQTALDAIASQYETSGVLSIPLVTLHTSGDEVIPDWHPNRYIGKTILADNLAMHEHIAVDGYGHCEFELETILDAFDQLVVMVENPPTYEPVTRIALPLITK